MSHIRIHSYFCLIAILMVSTNACNVYPSPDAGSDIDAIFDGDGGGTAYDGDGGTADDGDVADIDSHPGVIIIEPQPKEDLGYTDDYIVVWAIVGDDREVVQAEVFLSGEFESWTAKMDLQLYDSPEYNPEYKEYAASYVAVFPDHCFVSLEEYEITVVVKDSSDQTASDSVVAEYCRECMPCAIIIEFSEGTTEEAITDVGAGIGAYIERQAAYSERSYVIAFPVDVDRYDVIDTFRSAGIVDWFDELCFYCYAFDDL